MKLSQFRKQDVRKMMRSAAVLAGMIFIVFLAAFIYAKPKIKAFIAKQAAEQEKREAAQRVAKLEEDLKQRELSKERERINKEYEKKQDKKIEEQNEPKEETASWYEYFAEDCSWQEAAQRCRDKGGYLANVGSKEEFDEIVSGIESTGLLETVFYLGAKRNGGQDYYWLNSEGEKEESPIDTGGEDEIGSLWMQGEPSYFDGEVEENVLAMLYVQKESRWALNDVPDDILANFSYYSGKIGYICEYSE